jgi:two-component system sensor kinase
MDGPLRVLLIEDDKTDVELVLRALRKTFGPCEYRRVASIESLAGMVRTFEPHLAITDHRLPGFSGFEALTTVLRESPATPVIVVTGTLGEEGAADYIKAGAADFVLKNNLHRLGPAVTSALTGGPRKGARAPRNGSGRWWSTVRT